MTRPDMAAFWDERADEDAFWFVDSTAEYRNVDRERFWAEGAETVARILGLLDARIEPGDVVVEIGCGVGRLTRALAPAAAAVEALDVSPRMIALAREHNPGLANVRWHVGDGTSLRPFADASADVVFSHVVFQHIPEPGITLGYVREMGRVLRPGGWAAFHVSTDPHIHRVPVGSLLHRLAVRLGRAPRGRDRPEWRGAPIDLAALREAADAAGLDTERIVGEGTQFTLVKLRRR